MSDSSVCCTLLDKCTETLWTSVFPPVQWNSWINQIHRPGSFWPDSAIGLFVYGPSAENNFYNLKRFLKNKAETGYDPSNQSFILFGLLQKRLAHPWVSWLRSFYNFQGPVWDPGSLDV